MLPRFPPRALAAQLALATAVSAALCVAAWIMAGGALRPSAIRFPRGLDVRTDVVGFATFYDFDLDSYFLAYALALGVFPLLVGALFLAFARIAGRRADPLEAAALEDRAPAVYDEPDTGRRAWPRRALAIGFVGAVLALELAVARGRGSGWGWVPEVLLPTVAVYALAVAALAALVARSRRARAGDAVAAANAVLAATVLLGLYGVSRGSGVYVVDAARVIATRWLPLWAAVGLAACAGTAAVASLARGRRPALVEGRMLRLVVAPAALFAMLATVPGAIGPVDVYEEGVQLAGARLVEHGQFPWRDIFFTHGILPDVGEGALAFVVFGHTRWSWWAASELFYRPLFWVSVYFLCAHLFRRNLLFLLATQLMVVLALVPVAWITYPRFTPLAFELLLLAAVFAKPSWPRAAALVGLVGLHAVLVPEAAIVALAVGAAVVLQELTGRRGDPAAARGFPRTVRCAISAAVFVAALVAVLLSQHALDGFELWYRTFVAGGYDLATGIPLTAQPGPRWFAFALVVPALLWALTLVFLVVKLQRRRPVSIDEWVVGALALVVALSYRKFFGRADGHVYQTFAIALPLVFYWTFRALTLAESRLPAVFPRLRRPLPSRRALSAVAVGVVVVAAPTSVAAAIEQTPAHFRAAAPTQLPRLGFTNPGDLDPTLVADLRRVAATYLTPSDTIFDLTNSPALFYFVLGRESPTRYYHVMMAFNGRSQADLVHELERTRPKLVAFSRDDPAGMDLWDGIPNNVRHYDVSRYVLDHYRPLLSTHGYLLLLRDDVPAMPRRAKLARSLSSPPVTSGLYFRTFPCDWGYAPNFLTAAPAAAPAVQLPATAGRALLQSSGWAVDTARHPVETVVAAVDGHVVATIRPALAREDVARAVQTTSDAKLGFRASRVVDRKFVGRLLRYYAVTANGRAAQLSYATTAAIAPQGPGPRTLRLADGRRVPVISGAATGWLETGGGVVVRRTFSFDLPPPSSRRRLGWLELSTGAPLGDDRFVLTDEAGLGGDAARTIAFRSLPRSGRTLRVQVGSCLQWHGYTSRRLYLVPDGPPDVRSIRLLR